MRKVLKKMVAFISTACIVSCTFMSTSAHDADYYSGTYTNSAYPDYIKFRVETSAQNSVLTRDVYESIFDWNDISSNVEVGLAMAVPGMPTTGFFGIHGRTYTDGTFGETIVYKSDGTMVSNLSGVNSNWSSATIYVNTSYYTSSSKTASAKKTIVHEVGHVLKLAHPTVNSSLREHTHNGKPCAVMNQGLPNGTSIPYTVADHDRTNLKAKWRA